MKAVMYGAGNIGRGFIGALFSKSGYEVTFVDVAEPVVNALKENNTYPVRYVSTEGYEDEWIKNVTAVNGNDVNAVADAISNCDIMATAVGPRILKFIIPNIVEGLRKRWKSNKGNLNIIICENLMDANKVIEGMLKEKLTEEECAMLDKTVGLVEASIGRMVPVQTEEMKDGEPLRVCVEKYAFLPVDKDAFKGEIPKIDNLVPSTPFDFYLKRKLYLHNMGHALCAYLGGFNGRKYVWQAIEDPNVLYIVQNAMIDSATAICKKFGVAVESLLPHINDLLERFRNKALGDTCARVGGDPVRKLGANDRLVGSALLCIEQGVSPAFIALGIAGAVYRYLNESGKEQTVENARDSLKEISELSADDQLTKIVLELYGYFLQGEDTQIMRLAVQALKKKSLINVI